MNAPIINLRNLSPSATKLEIAVELAKQGHRIGPVMKSIDGWPAYPLPHGLGSDPWVSATTDVDSIAHFFTDDKDDNILVGIASTANSRRSWHIYAERSLEALKQKARVANCFLPWRSDT